MVSSYWSNLDYQLRHTFWTSRVLNQDMAVKFMIFFASRHSKIAFNSPRCPRQCEDHLFKYQDSKVAKKANKAADKKHGATLDIIEAPEKSDLGYDVPMEDFSPVKDTLRPTKTFMFNKLDSPDPA